MNHSETFKQLLEDHDLENTDMYFKILKMFQEADREIERARKKYLEAVEILLREN